MLTLKPLFVLTGTLRIEGGKTGKQTDAPIADKAPKGKQRIHTAVTRVVTDDRRRGDVIVSDYLRRIKRLRLLKTPFGTLIEPLHLGELKGLLDEITKSSAAFNESSKTCELTNCLLWEPLRENRKAAVEGWVARQIKKNDPEALAVFDRLRA